MKDLKSLRKIKGFVKCAHCGVNNVQTLKYCKNCGHKLTVLAEKNSSSSSIYSTSEGQIQETLKRCREYVETKLGFNEIDTQVLPVEGMSLSMMSLLVEDANRKKKKIRFIKRATIVSCVTGIVAGCYLYDQRDIRAAKIAYANEQLDLLMDLKEEMTSEDWRKFEKYQASELEGRIREAYQGKVDPQTIVVEIERLLNVAEDESLKKALEEDNQAIESLIADDKAYQSGIKAKADGLNLEAYKEFLKVSESYSKAKEVRSYLNQLQPSALAEWKTYIQQLSEEKKHSEIVEEATLYLSIQPKDANVVAMKKQAEQLVKKQVETAGISSEKIEETSKNEVGVEDTIENMKGETFQVKEPVNEEVAEFKYLTLKNEQIIELDQVKLYFKLNRLAPTLWPDNVSSTSNSVESEAGTVYFEFLFSVTNQGEEGLNLIELIQGATVADGDGNAYEQFAGFYNETSEKISPIHPWSLLAPGETTTMHIVIQVPKELKTKVTPLTARIKIKDQWYQKDIPAQ